MEMRPEFAFDNAMHRGAVDAVLRGKDILRRVLRQAANSANIVLGQHSKRIVLPAPRLLGVRALLFHRIGIQLQRDVAVLASKAAAITFGFFRGAADTRHPRVAACALGAIHVSSSVGIKGVSLWVQ